MHQNRRTGNKVGMEIRNLKVIDRYRCFQQFMRNFFHHHIRAVQQPQLIPGAQIHRIHLFPFIFFALLFTLRDTDMVTYRMEFVNIGKNFFII